MKRIVRLTESDLVKLVKRVINETTIEPLQPKIVIKKVEKVKQTNSMDSLVYGIKKIRRDSIWSKIKIGNVYLESGVNFPATVLDLESDEKQIAQNTKGKIENFVAFTMTKKITKPGDKFSIELLTKDGKVISTSPQMPKTGEDGVYRVEFYIQDLQPNNYIVRPTDNPKSYVSFSVKQKK